MDTEQLEYWNFQNQFPYPHAAADHSPDLSPSSSLTTSPSFSDCEIFSSYAHYNHLTSMPEDYKLRYQFPLTPTDMSSSPNDSPFLTPALSLLEPARPSVSERQHVTSGRRRAQNRAAQRAFRERKEKHARDLEAKLHEMTEKYKNLEISHAELKVAYDKLHKTLDLLVKGDDDDRMPSNAETLRKLLLLLHGEITEREKPDDYS